jgi:uncharacterized membrane protein
MNITRNRWRSVNVGEAERRVSLAVGGLLMLYALRKSLGYLALLGTGSYLVYRGVTGTCRIYQTLGLSSAESEGKLPGRTGGQGSRTRIQQTVTVNKSPEVVYGYWRNLENLPQFMEHVQSVTADGDRSHWVAKAPLEVEWDAEIIDERENEMIAWRSLSSSQLDNAGTVRFRPAPDGYGTEVSVSLHYSPIGGPVGGAVAKLLKQVTSQQIREDMRRFKEVLEAGETATVEGQPSGRTSNDRVPSRDPYTGRPLNPAEPRQSQRERHKDIVQKASEESFPASDAPSWNMGRRQED